VSVDLLEPGIRLLHGLLRGRLRVVDQWAGGNVDYEFLNQRGVSPNDLAVDVDGVMI